MGVVNCANKLHDTACENRSNENLAKNDYSIMHLWIPRFIILWKCLGLV